MTIKVLEKTEGCMPVEFEVGDWMDLVTAEDIKLFAPYAINKRRRVKNDEIQESRRAVMFDFKLIPLGVAMQLPKGFEAYIVPRSSTFKKYGILQTNSEGIIDNSYCGNNDEWKLPVVATKEITIPKGTRIAQFRIQLTQKASVWQRLKWLFSQSVKIQKVQSLGNSDRGGFGEGTKN